jgi:hypothetical protein
VSPGRPPGDPVSSTSPDATSQRSAIASSSSSGLAIISAVLDR